MSEEKAHTLWGWFKEAKSWISLAISLSAVVVSMVTFYLVQAREGRLMVVLPVDIGARYAGENVELLVPLTLTNTGASPTRRHVWTVLAKLRPEEQPVGSTPALFRWEIEEKFISNLDYRTTYPKEEKQNVEDHELYVSRAAPFAASGGQSITKVMKFRQKEGHIQRASLTAFELTIIAKTEDEEITRSAAFKCSLEIGEEKTDWNAPPLTGVHKPAGACSTP